MGSSPPTVFESAPGCLADAVCVQDLVDADRTCLDLLSNTLSFCEILCPDARGQAEFTVVCEADRFLFCCECRNGEGWAKSFFLHGTHVVVGIRDHGWLVKESLKIRITPSACFDLYPRRSKIFDMVLNDLYLSCRRHSTDRGRFFVAGVLL